MKKLLVAAALVSGVSFAAGAKGTDAWKTLDKDGDGSLSAEEAAGDAELNSHFSTLDKNADGKLSAEEYKAHHADHAKGGKKAK
ncbi:MAG: EF-hand domain-containing protein [Bdellovibrionota bacterium]|nr:MAG: EF-hand domain-containing protein [Pseudomonadota bacterium]